MDEKREWPPAASSTLCPPCRQSECPSASEASFSWTPVTAMAATPDCHVCGALWKERCFILYLAGAELNWTVRPRKYDTICFLPCSGPSAWCQDISCYLSVLGLVKWASQETLLRTLSSVAQFILVRLQGCIYFFPWLPKWKKKKKSSCFLILFSKEKIYIHKFIHGLPFPPFLLWSFFLL